MALCAWDGRLITFRAFCANIVGIFIWTSTITSSCLRFVTMSRIKRLAQKNADNNIKFRTLTMNQREINLSQDRPEQIPRTC